MRTRAWTASVVLFLGLWVLATPAEAVITAELPLETLIKDATFIVTAKVESLDPAKLQMVLTVADTLKGKANVTRCPVVLKGDAEAVKNKQTPALLKRLAPKVPVILFVIQREDDYRAFAYSNGTWFQLEGVKPEGADTVRWSFTHLEPYLRRTYKGSTAELQQVLVDVEAGKRKPPATDAREKPGLGPELEEDKKETRSTTPTFRLVGGPVLGVIALPTIAGPLAVLAMLFPSVFGGYKKWMAFLSVVCTTSTVYFVFDWWLAPSLVGTIWATPLALWLALTYVTFLGCVWSWRRYVALVETGQMLPAVENLPEERSWKAAVPTNQTALQNRPNQVGGSGEAAYGAIDPPEISQNNRPASIMEPLMLSGLTFVGASLLGFGWFTNKDLLETTWLLVATTTIAAAITLLVSILSRRRTNLTGPGIPGEVVLLTSMTLVSLFFAGTQAGVSRATTVGTTQGEVASAEDLPVQAGKRLWKKSWSFRGSIAAAPLVAEDRVYVALADQGAWRQGIVSCLDAGTGKELWNTAKTLPKMKMISISSPCLSGGNLYVGEGYHEDQFCHLYCLDAKDGALKWKFQTKSHVESSPVVVDGKVYFGAGDDGIHCLDAQSGEPVWHYPGLHIDSSPLVHKGRVYAGSGVGDEVKQPALICLDASKGSRIWQLDLKQPAWGSPVLAGDLLYVGFGEGRVGEVLAHTVEGGLLAVNIQTGEEKWRFKTDQPVLGRAAIDRRFVYFGCRDDLVYCLDRKTGKRVWEHSLGGPLSAGLALARSADTGESTSLYAVVETGLLYCLNPLSGKIYWQEDLRTNNVPVLMVATPTVTVKPGPAGQTRRIYLGMIINPNGSSTPQLNCFEDQINAQQDAPVSAGP